MKYLFAVLAFAIIFAPSAHAEDIMSILERQSKVEKPSPPVLNPYNYTVDVVMSGREGKDEKPPFMAKLLICLLYTSPSPRDGLLSRMPSSA